MRQKANCPGNKNLSLLEWKELSFVLSLPFRRTGHVNIPPLSVLRLRISDYQTTDALVSFKEKPDAAEQALIRNVGGKVKRNYHIVPTIAASVPKGKLHSLRRNPKVASVEEDVTLQILGDVVPWTIDQRDAEIVRSQNKG